jgi:hypothetical protein
MVEVVVLSRHGAEARHLPHEPLEHLDLAAQVLRDELPRLAREVEEDRARLEDRDRLLAIGGAWSTIAGMLLFGENLRNPA